MNEFIVWDNWLKKFSNVNLKDGIKIPLNDKNTLHSYIGKTDINDKKIYADCSIVEFNDGSKAYFTYDIYSLCYKLAFLHTELRVSYSAFCNPTLKVIDTIQENKLGLIK